MKEIQLTKGKVALVDDADFEWLNRRRWHASLHGALWYARTRYGSRLVYMHRLILGLTDPKIQGDHTDHDGLNNQKYNLRIATRSHNAANMRLRVGYTSKFKGVFWCTWTGRWRASITINNKSKHLGRYDTEEAAAAAYTEAARRYFGEFAFTESR